MKIIVPSDIGNDLELLPEGTCKGVVSDMFYGRSASNNPKLTIRWTLITDITDADGNTHDAAGKTVLDTYSLQPQAIWRVNDLYRLVKQHNIPPNDYSPEEFVSLLKEALIGEEFNLSLYHDSYGGEVRTKVDNVTR